MGILETLCEERRADASRLRRERPFSSLERSLSPPRSSFSAWSDVASGKPALLIAECKKASPSRGLMVGDYDPVALARAYERGGAGMVSVLTEPRHFLGSDEDLVAVRGAIALPVLRKDFIVDPYQVREAWSLGADAILLIAAALEEGELIELAAAARELGLGVLIELHEGSELERAVKAQPDAIGVNARDLRSFRVDYELAGSLARLLPERPLKVAESGLRKPHEASALLAAGYRGFLVGEALATASDPEARTREFASALGTGLDG